MVGSKLDTVKGMAGGGDDKKDDAPAGDGEAAGEDPEVVAAREEEMQRRRDKFAKMEEDREKVRQGIREKYNLKKQEELNMFNMPQVEGSLNRQKKSPEELAALADEEGFDPMKMAENLLGTVKTGLANIPFPWNK